MKDKNIFEETCDKYLDIIGKIDLEAASDRLGAKYEENELRIRLFNDEFIVSPQKITDISGRRPAYDIRVILSKYILLCPQTPPHENEWVSYRDFKDSAPLRNYFRVEVEEAIASRFSGKSRELREASEFLGGCPPKIAANHDFAMRFDALPKIPLILLFNNADEEFPAASSILFESRCEKYLDCECIAMLGRRLYTNLAGAGK